jgi:hypothetical protein
MAIFSSAVAKPGMADARSHSDMPWADISEFMMRIIYQREPLTYSTHFIQLETMVAFYLS